MLVTKELVKTNDGVYKRLDSDVKFVEGTKDSDLHKLYEFLWLTQHLISRDPGQYPK